MFKFFSRKPDTEPTSSTAAAATDIQNEDLATSSNVQQLRTPSPSEPSLDRHLSVPGKNSPAPHPPETPSPAPESRTEHTPASLLSLVTSIPAKTLRQYTINHLKALPSSSLDPNPILAFFSDLAPPPILHCVRCHKGYCEVENDDRSCLIPHDDDSAEVERVGTGKIARGSVAHFETLWGCCGRTVEGDGDQGPPDGWCYEGKHTTDAKRARFRDDSTLNDDKLIPCSRLRCHDQEYQRSARKRRRTLAYSSDDSRYGAESNDGAEEVAENPSPKSTTSRKGKGRSRAGTSISGRVPAPSESSAPAPRKKKSGTAKKARLEGNVDAEDIMAVDEDGQQQGGDDTEPKKPTPQKKPRKPRAPKSTAKPASEIGNAAGADVEMDGAPAMDAVPAAETEAKKPAKKRAPAKPRAPKPKSKATTSTIPTKFNDNEIPTDVEMDLPETPTANVSFSAKADHSASAKMRTRMKPKQKMPLSILAGAQANASASGADADAEEDDDDGPDGEDGEDDSEYIPSSSKVKKVRPTAKPTPSSKVKVSQEVEKGAVSATKKPKSTATISKPRGRKLSEVVPGSVPGEESLTGAR